MPIRITESITYDFGAVYGRATGPVRLKHHFGFDPDARFQRLAVGTRRILSTIGGPIAGLKFVLSGASTCKIVTTDMSYKGPNGAAGIVCIEGVNPGTGGKLELQNSAGKAVEAIDLHVGQFVGIKVRFYNLIDGKGRKGVSTIPFAPLPLFFPNQR